MKPTKLSAISLLQNGIFLRLYCHKHSSLLLQSKVYVAIERKVFRQIRLKAIRNRYEMRDEREMMENQRRLRQQEVKNLKLEAERWAVNAVNHEERNKPEVDSKKLARRLTYYKCETE